MPLKKTFFAACHTLCRFLAFYAMINILFFYTTIYNLNVYLVLQLFLFLFVLCIMFFSHLIILYSFSYPVMKFGSNNFCFNILLIIKFHIFRGTLSYSIQIQKCPTIAFLEIRIKICMDQYTDFITLEYRSNSIILSICMNKISGEHKDLVYLRPDQKRWMVTQITWRTCEG